MIESPEIIDLTADDASVEVDEIAKSLETHLNAESHDARIHEEKSSEVDKCEPVKKRVTRRLIVLDDDEVELVVKNKVPNVNVKKIMDKINSHPDGDIKLLRDEEVVKWICGDTEFLNIFEETRNKSNDDKKRKINEDIWGWNKYNDLIKPLKEISKKQWTTCFGQTIGKELYLLQNNKVWKPKKKNNYEPDLEIDSHIVEIKTQTFFTTGTAGEKILGSPFKYASIPKLYSKPLVILCIGGAEKISREMYGNLGSKASAEQRKLLNFLSSELSIRFEGAIDILKKIVN